MLLGLAPFIIFFGLETYYPKANGDISYVVTIIVLAHLVTSISAVLLNFLAIRLFMIRSVSLLLLIYLLAGVIDSIVLIAGFDIPWIPPGSGISAWSLLSVASIVTAAWLLMGHLALGLLLGNARAYSQIQTWNAELMNLNASAKAELLRYRETLQGAIAERIERVLTQISTQLDNLTGTTDPKLLLSTAAKVRELSEKDVRRLSHELSETTTETFRSAKTKRRFSWLSFFRFGGDASANIPWVLSIGTLQAVSLALAIGDFMTTVVVLVSLLIGFPILVLVDRQRRKLIASSPLWIQIVSAPFEYLLMSLLGVQIVKFIAQDVGGLNIHVNTFMTAVPIGAISIWLLIYLIRGFSATYQIRTQQLTQISKELLDSLVEVRAELAGIRNKLARILHGSVQGRLASVSLALTATASANTTKEAKLLILRAKSQLALAKTDLLESFNPSPQSSDFESQLNTLVAGWQGLIELDLVSNEKISKVLNSRSILGNKIIEAMQECLTNAVRHGSAKTVQITLKLVDNRLVLISRNANESGKLQGTPGLGWQQMQAGADSMQTEAQNGTFEVQLTWGL